MTLVKFNNRSNTLIPGVNDVFESIFNDTFFNDTIVIYFAALSLIRIVIIATPP